VFTAGGQWAYRHSPLDKARLATAY